MDYYKSLALANGASDAEIKKAYRKLAIQWHPKRNTTKSREVVESKFVEISEAYHVLSDAKLRAIFDQYGEKGLKNGAVNGDGGKISPWNYNANPEEQFNAFFGSFSPFADYFDEEGGYANLFANNSKKAGPKLDAHVLNIYCSLEELFKGCSKKQKVVRQKLKADGSNTVPEEKTMTIEVNAGWREGTKITFANEGDEGKGRTTGDIIFVLKEIPHNKFTRTKHDLAYTADITLVEALTGCIVYVNTLDGRKLPIPINQIVQPGYVKTVKGEGMPKGNSSGRGDLIITFNISYPEFLTDDQKVAIKETLN